MEFVYVIGGLIGVAMPWIIGAWMLGKVLDLAYGD